MVSDYYRPASSRHKLATGELPGALVGAIIGGLAGAGTGAVGMYTRNKDLELEQAAGVVSKKKKHSVGISAAIGGVTGAVLGGLAGSAITHVPGYQGYKPQKPREPKKSVEPFFGPGAKKMNKAKTPDRQSFTNKDKVDPEKYLKQYYKDAPGGWNQVKTTSIEAASETPNHRHVSDLSHIPKTYLGTVDARKADNLNDAEGMCASAEIPLSPNPDHPFKIVNIEGHLPSGSQDFDYQIHGGWPLNGINNRMNGLGGHRPISADEAGTLILGHEARHAATMLDRQTLPPEATPPRYVYPYRQAELTQALGSLKAETAQMSGGRVIHNSDDFRRLMNDAGVTSPDKKVLDDVKEQYSPEGARMLHYMRSIWMKDPEKYEELLDAWDTEKLYDQVVKGQGPPGLKIATAKNFFKNKRAEGLLQLPEPKKPGKLSVLVTKPDALSKKIAELVTPELPEEKPRSLSAQVLNPKPEALSKKIASELLKGGPGDNKPDSDFNPRDLAKGIKEEQAEHGGQVRVIKELVKDHLTEHPKEYSKRAAHPALGPLLLAKEKSDKGDYGGKYQILRTLVSDAPQDWKVDSESEGIYGLTHNPTGFKMHAPRQILPQGTGIEERWRASKPSNTDVSAALQSKVAASRMAKKKDAGFDGLGSGLTFQEWISKARSKPDSLSKKIASSAPGIPDRSDYGDTARLTPGQLADMIVQDHSAIRAGNHKDVRIGTPDTNLFSWATKKDFPVEVGKPIALHRQPLHSHAYGQYEGDIGPGYGEGSVSKALQRKILITKNDPSGFSFTAAEGNPDRYRFKAPDSESDPWMAFKAGPTPDLTHPKFHMKSVPIDDILANLPEDNTFSIQPKVDGALQALRWRNDKPEILSHRLSKRTGRQIERTEHLFGMRPDVPRPMGITSGMELLGEFTAEKDGRPLEPQATGGYLNSSLAKATEARNSGLNTKLRLFDIAGSNLPPSERRKLLEAASSSLPGVEVMPEENTREGAKEMIRQILAGTHPLTKEGVIYRGHDGVPVKGKVLDDSDVVISGTFPGKGKYKDSFGGFTYSNTPGGEVVGRVGGGFSDATRATLGDQLGRIARIRSGGKFPSGAHRSPVFVALHEG